MKLWTAFLAGSLFRMPMVIGRGSGDPEANIASGGNFAAGENFYASILA